MFENLAARFAEVVKKITGNSRLTENNIAEALEQIRLALLDADVPVKVTNSFLEQVRAKALGEKVISSLKPGEVLVKIVYDELVKVLGAETAELKCKAVPTVVMLVGLQGAGKTTTVAKLARLFSTREKRRVAVVSVDLYRPAAREQLKILADEIKVPYLDIAGDNPLEIAKIALSEAARAGFELLIFDTAGRSQIDTAMMAELEQLVHRVQPHEILLTVDSMLGQDAVNIAESFAARVPLTGVILTKTDGDARGGAALAMRQLTGQPIKFIGTGEKVDGIESFHPERVASSILGMGDIVTLVEDVYHKADQKKAEHLAKKLVRGQGFDLNDFRDQLQQMRNIGGLEAIMSKLPQLGSLGAAKNLLDERKLVHMEAIINSMTAKERAFPAFIQGSNKRRIAAGSGRPIQEVSQLLKQFTQAQKMLGRFNSSKFKMAINYLKGNLL